jgi:hypothetical protein
MLRSGTKEPVPWRARGCLLTFSDIGTAGGVAVGQLLRRVLFSIQSGDWTAFALQRLSRRVLGLVPAGYRLGRAAKVDPTVALRWDY